jgi:hypothetical protein
MAETIDLSGDGGVLKTVVRKAKEDAIAPSDSLPLVDGTAISLSCFEQALHMQYFFYDLQYALLFVNWFYFLS